MKNKKRVFVIVLVLFAVVVGMAIAAPVRGKILVGSGSGYKVWAEGNKTWVDTETVAKFVIDFSRRVGRDQYEVWCTGVGSTVIGSYSDISSIASKAGVSLPGGSALDLWKALCSIGE